MQDHSALPSGRMRQSHRSMAAAAGLRRVAVTRHLADPESPGALGRIVGMPQRRYRRTDREVARRGGQGPPPPVLDYIGCDDADGRIAIGADAAIGAGCVVTRDAPAWGVVVGMPGEVISLDGSTGYIIRVHPRLR